MNVIQLFDPHTSTFTYLLADPSGGEAALIDPVIEQTEAYLSLLDRLGLRLIYTLETHVHADHITAGGVLRDRLGNQTILHVDSGVSCASRMVSDGELLPLGEQTIKVLHTPGHTQADICYYLDGRVFTGDTLFIGGCGRTDFQDGDPGTLYDSVHNTLFTLPSDTLVFPGHDYNGNTVSTIGWERAHNGRLGGAKTRDAFIAIMNNLNLSYPKQIAKAVPANQACGRPVAPIDALKAASKQTDAGWHEIAPHSAAVLLANATRVIDVRRSDEYHGTLGHISASSHVPMEQVTDLSEEWDLDEAVMVICRSGSRSAKVAAELAKQGFGHVFNIQGGMIAWNEAGFPTKYTLREV